MLKKLLKYDLKFVYKPLIVFYILFIFFSIITRIVENINNTNPTMIIVILNKILVGIMIALIANIIINCFMRNLVRFLRSNYKDESYLTHTLPVNKSTIYLSKVLTIVITLFTSFIIIIGGIAIAILTKDTWNAFKVFLEESSIYFNSSVFGLVSTIVLTIFFEFLFMIMCGVLGIIIGNRANNGKLIKSIIIGFAIYMVFSIMSVSILYLIGLFNPTILSLFNNLTVSSAAMKSMMIISTSIYFIYNVIIYFTGNKLFNKGINVE